MVVLGSDASERRFAQCSVLLERLVENFNRPPFLVDRKNGIPFEGCVAASQIEYPRAAILVLKDLAHEFHCERHVFEPDSESGLF